MATRYAIRDAQGWTAQQMDTLRDAETLLISHGYRQIADRPDAIPQANIWTRDTPPESDRYMFIREYTYDDSPVSTFVTPSLSRDDAEWLRRTVSRGVRNAHTSRIIAQIDRALESRLERAGRAY